MNQKEICAHCGEFLPAEDGFYFEDQFFCPDCLEELTQLCHHCGERIWQRSNRGTDSIPLCDDCYDAYYTHCDCCGTKTRCTTTRRTPCAGPVMRPDSGSEKASMRITTNPHPSSMETALASSASSWKWTKEAKTLTVLRRS